MKTRIGIVGNGVLGLSSALKLSERMGSSSVEITVIGPSNMVGAGSLAAAAMLNSFAEVESNSLSHEVDKNRFSLSDKASKMWPLYARDLAEKLGYNINHLYGNGTFVVNNTASNELDDENFSAILDALNEYKEPHSLVNPADIPGYLPEERNRALRCVRIDNEGYVQPRILMKWLKEACVNEGIIFEDDQVLKIAKAEKNIWRVFTQALNSWEYDILILANGATLTQLLQESKLELGIQKVFFGVGVSIELIPRYEPETCIRTPNRGLACGVYSAPYFDEESGRRNLLIGASNLVSPIPIFEGNISNVVTLLNAAQNQINQNLYNARIKRINVGWRPTSQDTYPLVGKIQHENLYIVNGTKRDGIHLAPLIAADISEQISSHSFESEFGLFHPQRKLIWTMSKDEGVNKALKHRISADFQHGFEKPTLRMDQVLRAAYLRDIDEIYQNSGIDSFGIPVELLDMYRYGHAKV